MIGLFICIGIGWFAYWFFVCATVVRFQNIIYRLHPDKSKQLLGEDKALGLLNKQMGFLFLWDREIKELTKAEPKLEKQRKFAVNCLMLSWAIMAAFPGVAILCFWLLVR